MVYSERGVQIFIVVLLILIGWLVFKINEPVKHNFITAKLNNETLQLELALNSEQWFNGLSNRPSLCESCGMLFIFPQAENKTFVMRQMNFPLDIVWLNNKTVIGYSENLKPENQTPYTQYHSPGLVDMVLELPANFIKTKQIKIGDKLIYEGNF